MLKTYLYNGMKLEYEEGQQPAGAVEFKRPAAKAVEPPKAKAEKPAATKAVKPANKSKAVKNK